MQFADDTTVVTKFPSLSDVIAKANTITERTKEWFIVKQT